MFRRHTRYHQGVLLKKINRYLALSHKQQISEEGHCHGLATLWLKRMAQHREREFYRTIKSIIDCPDEQLWRMSFIIDAFFKKIDKRQRPEVYHIDVNQEMMASTQTNLDKTYLKKQLVTLFKNHHQNGNMFCISNAKVYKVDGELVKHAIAVFVRNNHFYCYDANYDSGVAKRFRNTDDLIIEIRKRLFSQFTLPIPSKIPLEIKKIESKNLKPKREKSLWELAGHTLFDPISNVVNHPYYYLMSAAQLFSPSIDALSAKRHGDTLNSTADAHTSKRRKLR